MALDKQEIRLRLAEALASVPGFIRVSHRGVKVDLLHTMVDALEEVVVSSKGKEPSAEAKAAAKADAQAKAQAKADASKAKSGKPGKADEGSEAGSADKGESSPLD